jgi:hypothetical protein
LAVVVALLFRHLDGKEQGFGRPWSWHRFGKVKDHIEPHVWFW